MKFKDEEQIISNIILQLGTCTVGITIFPEKFLESDQHFVLECVEKVQNCLAVLADLQQDCNQMIQVVAT